MTSLSSTNTIYSADDTTSKLCTTTSPPSTQILTTIADPATGSTATDLPSSAGASEIPMAHFYQLSAAAPNGISEPAHLSHAIKSGNAPLINDLTCSTGGVQASLMHSGSYASMVHGDGQLSKEWIQSLISQTGRASYAYDGAAYPAPCKRDPSQTGSSDSDSDEISRSLSFLLSQQQQQQQLQANAKRLHTIGLLPQSGEYNATLVDILGLGFDHSRRVLSLPNSIGNMAMDMPVDAHAPGMMDMPMVAGLGVDKPEDVQQMDPMIAAAAAAGIPAQSFLSSQLAPTMLTQPLQQSLVPDSAPMPPHHHLGIIGPTVHGGQRPADILSFHTQIYPPLSSAAMPSSSIAVCNSDRSTMGTGMSAAMLGLAGLKRGFHTTAPSPEKTTLSLDDNKPVTQSSTAPSTPRAKRGRPRSAKRQAQRSSTAKTACDIDVHERKPESTMVTETTGLPTAPVHPSLFAGSQSGPSHTSLIVSDPPGNPISDIAASHSSGTPSLSSSTSTPAMPGLIPHRVDRQLAAAARPLLFVRPRIKDDQPRRRKRRCLSTNPGSASVGTPVDTPADIMSAVPLPVLSLGEDGQTNLQWQRISEQRRRDAMRENFDLLKRMLPQEYMTSDDGRELARPVLLARFLRWVDDTLIEMENLKSEVAQLKMQQMQQMQQQSSAAPIGSQQGNCGWEGQASDAAPQQINDSSPMWEVAEAVAVAAAAAAATATATTASSSSSEGDTAESSHMQGQPPTQTVTPASDVSSQLLGDL